MASTFSIISRRAAPVNTHPHINGPELITKDREREEGGGGWGQWVKCHSFNGAIKSPQEGLETLSETLAARPLKAPPTTGRLASHPS